ncbi:MAG: thymidine kinase [Pseudomonadota bacterium]
MAKLYFYYSSMNAGKSSNLLQSSFNYRERGMRTLLFTAAIDDRFGSGVIRSRIGLEAKAKIFDGASRLYEEVAAALEEGPIACVLVDEAQFLGRDQVFDLARVCDELNVPVLAYGLRTDFQAELFEGSRYLLGLADELRELKTICPCGKKATMNLRLDSEGRAVREGAQTEIGGEDRYIALCRKHFMEKLGACK